eukprot:scaffold41124_cov32-Tisochrysis_lutea.AAC.2
MLVGTVRDAPRHPGPAQRRIQSVKSSRSWLEAAGTRRRTACPPAPGRYWLHVLALASSAGRQRSPSRRRHWHPSE